MPSDTRFVPRTQNELMAYRLASALNDLHGIRYYLSLATRFPHDVLLQQLAIVLEIPDAGIKTTRARYFNGCMKRRQSGPSKAMPSRPLHTSAGSWYSAGAVIEERKTNSIPF